MEELQKVVLKKKKEGKKATGSNTNYYKST